MSDPRRFKILNVDDYEIGLYNGDILGNPTSAFLAVTLMDVWEWTPLIALIVLAGLTSMPRQVLEAAAIDGAGYWSRLRDIVLPMISGVIIVALLIRSSSRARRDSSGVRR